MKKIIILVCVSIVAVPAMSQSDVKIHLQAEGSLATFRGQTSIATEFNYDSMLIGHGKNNITEQEYISTRRKMKNEKEPGNGDRWAQTWVADRKDYASRFNEYFAKSSGLTVTPSSAFTLRVKTTITEPGYNAFVTRSSAYIDAEISIVEIATQKVIAKIKVFKCISLKKADDYDQGARLASAYQHLGIMVGEFLARHLSK